MGPCPYCGENIGAEARVCRYCQRKVMYSLVLTSSLEERQKHELIRLWQQQDWKSIRHESLANYSDAKKKLENIPLTLAWDLNLFQASIWAQKFSDYGIEFRLQGGLPSGIDQPIEVPQNTSRSFSFLNILYAGVGMGLVAGAIYLIMKEPPRTKFIDQYSIQQSQPPVPSFDQAPQVNIIQDPSTTYKSPAQPLQGFEPTPENRLERSEAERALGATVFILGEASLGSGFIITSNGYILSNSHVTRDMKEPIVKLRNGKSYSARKIKEDPRYDISLLKIDEVGLPTFRLGDANRVYATEPVWVIGNPGGLAFSVSRGVVSFNGRLLGDVPYIQTDAAINRGNSGGPMLNQALEVIGINTLTSLNEQNISFALPINLACDLRGVTNDIPGLPTCPSYQGPQEEMEQVTQSLGRAPSSNVQKYQNEIDEHMAAFQRAQNDANKELAELSEKEAALQQQLANDSRNASLFERIKPEIEQIQVKKKDLAKAKAEAQLRFIDSAIAVLERQALDPEFKSIRSRIDDQISQLRGNRQQLLDFINQ